MENKKELKCDSCRQANYFEYNHDGSYVMCMYCSRAYKGGYEELRRLNYDQLSDVKMERVLQFK